MPSRGASWLDKCKSIGPEIERAVKSYSVYSRMGKIDGDYFPYESFKSFGDLNALSEKKYAIGGTCFERWGFFLLSDQCMLAYRRGHDDRARCFFDLITKATVSIDDYDAAYAKVLQQLVDRQLVSICEETGALSPTPRSICLKAVWDNGAIALGGCGDGDLALIDGLVSDEMLSYCGKLFAPDEAAYLDYMFNDASFPNSQGLRNRYDHTHSPIADPDAEGIRSDYYRMLTLLVAITLKINDELSAATGRGHLENFVDWPYLRRKRPRIHQKNDHKKGMKRSVTLRLNDANDNKSEPASLRPWVSPLFFVGSSPTDSSIALAATSSGATRHHAGALRLGRNRATRHQHTAHQETVPASTHDAAGAAFGYRQDVNSTSMRFERPGAQASDAAAVSSTGAASLEKLSETVKVAMQIVHDSGRVARKELMEQTGSGK